MKAKIISVINQKGGCGKSSTCIFLAAELSKRGSAVVLIDSDSQGTSTAWAKAAPDNALFSVPVMNFSAYAEKIHREIQKQLGNYEFIIVDCGPSLEALAPLSALLVSNLAIVPVVPAPADLWAARGALALIGRAQFINEGLRAAILPSRVGRTTLSKAIMAELKDFGIPLMRSQLSNRVAFQEAVLSGLAVSDLGRNAKAAADEVVAMTDEILELLGEQ